MSLRLSQDDGDGDGDDGGGDVLPCPYRQTPTLYSRTITFSQHSVLSCFSPSPTPFEQVLTSIISVKNHALLPLGFSCHHNEFMLFILTIVSRDI